MEFLASFFGKMGVTEYVIRLSSTTFLRLNSY